MRRMLRGRRAYETGGPSPMPAPGNFNTSAAAFFGGVKSAWTSVFFLVLAGTYIGIGALAHDFGLSSWWLALSTLLVWAAPAQVILVLSLIHISEPTRLGMISY